MEVLSRFDALPEQMEFTKLRDELVEQISQLLGCNYETVGMEISEKEARQRLLESPTRTELKIDEEQLLSKQDESGFQVELKEEDILALPLVPVYKEPAVKVTRSRIEPDATENSQHISVQARPAAAESEQNQRAADVADDENIISPVESTPRAGAIENMVGKLTGEPGQDFQNSDIGQVDPLPEIWHIGEGVDSVDELRVHMYSR